MSLDCFYLRYFTLTSHLSSFSLLAFCASRFSCLSLFVLLICKEELALITQFCDTSLSTLSEFVFGGFPQLFSVVAFFFLSPVCHSVFWSLTYTKMRTKKCKSGWLNIIIHKYKLNKCAIRSLCKELVKDM